MLQAFLVQENNIFCKNSVLIGQNGLKLKLTKEMYLKQILI